MNSERAKIESERIKYLMYLKKQKEIELNEILKELRKLVQK